MKATEREAEEAKRENREAKEAFNKVKKKRWVSSGSVAIGQFN
jgi:hypothetical protein